MPITKTKKCTRAFFVWCQRNKKLVVCTLVRGVVSACEWGDMLADTLVYRHGDPGLVGPELLAGFAGRNSVGAFWLLSPTPMLGSDTRASTRNKIGTKATDAPGYDQNYSRMVCVASFDPSLNERLCRILWRRAR